MKKSDRNEVFLSEVLLRPQGNYKLILNANRRSQFWFFHLNHCIAEEWSRTQCMLQPAVTVVLDLILFVSLITGTKQVESSSDQATQCFSIPLC